MTPSPSAPSFVHLRVHTAYSLLEGAIRTKDLPGLCASHGMPAVGVTDTANMFGAMEVTAALKKGGIQPIIGLGLPLRLDTDGDSHGRNRERLPRLALLAKDEAGYQNLLKLTSLSYFKTESQDDAHVDMTDLATFSDGLICLSGGPDGPVNKLFLNNRARDAEALLAQFHDIFGDRFYVELQRHGRRSETIVEGPLIDWAYANQVPLVATNEPYFGDRDDYEAHDALICIKDGAYVMQDDRRKLTQEHYFKTQAEMAALFADLPEALESTVEIARRCAFAPARRDPILPDFKVDGGLSADDEMRRMAAEGLAKRLEVSGLHATREVYDKRLAYELDIISRMGFAGYFLIVSDFMRWARAKGIPIGVRGSGAASIVAWALDITNLDPLRFDLVFERFLNPERVSMPDFDIDFCQDRRGEVIAYVQEKYGHDQVAQIITFGTLQARACVRDVGRVLQMPYGQVDRISKMIPNPPGKPLSLTQAIDGEPRLQQMIKEDASVTRLMEIAKRLEGLYRHASTHAAGLVIGDRPLDELVPMYRDPRADMPVTQLHYKDAEEAGLVKFDFLGLKTLTVIARTEELLARRGIEINTQDLELADDKTFEMLARGDSIGVFQLESSGMRDLLRQMKPDRIEDLIALVALYRPGPMDSIPTYIACKRGREAPKYLTPQLEPILDETFGVMTYQEDVMQIARDLAGYSLGDADLLRRAMGKKIKSEMDKHEARFIEGAEKSGVAEPIARAIFEQAAKFAGYGFNKGHAAAYAQVAFHTAYLKAHYPVEFLAASMTLDIERTDRLNTFRVEARRLGIEVLPPDVNRSEAAFTVEQNPDGNWVIPYALGAIKNASANAMASIAEERATSGPYKDIFDFARRIDPQVVNKRSLEALAKAGAFDAIHPNRAQVFHAADVLTDYAALTKAEASSNQESMFGDGAIDAPPPKLPLSEEWTTNERLSAEMEAVGSYISGHPLDDYRQSLERARVSTYAEVLGGAGRHGKSIRIAGTIMERQDRKSQKSDRPFAYVRASDPTGEFEALVFSDVLYATREHLEPGNSVVFTVSVERADDDVRPIIQGVEAIDKVVASAGAGLKIFVSGVDAYSGIQECLKSRGKGIVTLVLAAEEGLREIHLDLPGRHQVDPATRQALKSLTGVAHVEEV